MKRKFISLTLQMAYANAATPFPPAPCRSTILTAHWPVGTNGLLQTKSSQTGMLARKLYILYSANPSFGIENMDLLVPSLAETGRLEGTAFLDEINGHISALEQALKAPELDIATRAALDKERKYFIRLERAARSPFLTGISEEQKAVAISRSLDLLTKELSTQEVVAKKYFENSDKKYPEEWQALIKVVKGNSDFVNHYKKLLLLAKNQKITVTPIETSVWAALVYHCNRRAAPPGFSLPSAQHEVWSFIDSSSGMDVPKAGYSAAAKAFAQKYATIEPFIEWAEYKKREYYAQAAKYLSDGNFGAYTNASYMGAYFSEMANMATGYAPIDP